MLRFCCLAGSVQDDHLPLISFIRGGSRHSVTHLCSDFGRAQQERRRTKDSCHGTRWPGRPWDWNVFGSKIGESATSMCDIILTKSWDDEEETESKKNERKRCPTDHDVDYSVQWNSCFGKKKKKIG